MIVGLVDERTGVAFPAAQHAAVRADGQAFAARVAQAKQAMGPTMRDGDNGGVISCLVVAAHELTPLAESVGPEHG
ncbi:hypothetical protein M6D93_18350 [Jatrophihabitans telluris]|uniref:Uncharacterized protein n=1 Tax=Jatrophihabitans telluris TaxID=2038343 RepID=A0ABY4QX12_9ACTN|nr:hypothetical protein [Jatrophihabitans telluris]UQX88226.1 hypothetical protein M6D93_18350 [Jatrophihabitans telluris]